MRLDETPLIGSLDKKQHNLSNNHDTERTNAVSQENGINQM